MNIRLRLKKKMARLGSLAKAVSRAAQHYGTISPKLAWTVLWSLLCPPPFDKKRWRGRMRGCWSCPAYDRAGKTCGNVETGPAWACYCWMPGKAKLNVSCTLYDATLGEESFWKIPLNRTFRPSREQMQALLQKPSP